MYKADLGPKETFQKMQDDPEAVMIDVRTQAEWAYVGGPVVERLMRLSWQVFPDMLVNDGFVEHFASAGLPKDTQIFLLCRSGVRSAAAATALTQAGYENCYNVATGFEGDKDDNGHRGNVNGWKHDGLPWMQG
ncbi:MAG: rhodanese-like domain-containing protein [Hyphomicrobiales bacterium]|nr:rhodanese-like domain-containing protein [Hyphomicrobiales bacterium]